MSHLPYTSQEVNKSFDKRRNKFYKGRWEVRVNGYCAGKQIVMHALALKSHQEACKCPFCGHTEEAWEYAARNFDYTIPNYDKVTGKRIEGKKVTISEEDRECPNCHKWWRVWSGIGIVSTVVNYDTEERWV